MDWKEAAGQIKVVLSLVDHLGNVLDAMLVRDPDLPIESVRASVTLLSVALGAVVERLGG